MSIISIVLVLLVAFLAGIEGILDEFQFHQPLVACTLIGLVTGNLEAGIVLGGTLQMLALGWANIGAAVAPDAALASVASAIILVLGGQGVNGVASAIAVAIPLAVAGLFLTMLVRTIAVPIVHMMDAAAEEGNMRKIEILHIMAVCLQGIRIVIPALVINMMATKEVWPFFIIGFVIAAISQLTLIALGALGVALALIYLKLSKMGGSSNGGGGNSGDPLGDILNDY